MSTCMICGSSCVTHIFSDLSRCLKCGFVHADIGERQPDFHALYDKKYFFGLDYHEMSREGSKNIASTCIRSLSTRDSM